MTVFYELATCMSRPIFFMNCYVFQLFFLLFFFFFFYRALCTMCAQFIFQHFQRLLFSLLSNVLIISSIRLNVAFIHPQPIHFHCHKYLLLVAFF